LLKLITKIWENKLDKRKSAMAFLVMCILFIFAGCGPKQTALQEYQRENFVMDTLVQVRVYADNAELGGKSLDAAFAEFTRIADLSDRFAARNLPNPEISDVYRINHNAGIKPVQVSEDTLLMLEKSQSLAEMSNGGFDVTIGPLMDLWGFGQEQYHLPDADELQSAMALVAYKRLQINKQDKTVFLPEKGMSIDLGGIAKGYATDQAIKKLRQMGIKSALINAGGNVYALGSKPDGSAWSTGIRDPRNDNGIIAVVKVKDTAVVSSGDYERYFMKDGIRYHHILDSYTGKPARQLIATTVVGPQATEADMLSTTLFVLGSRSGADLLKNKLTAYSAVFVDEQKKISVTGN
jgi:thiamine biosynthesis lipoprotein